MVTHGLADVEASQRVDSEHLMITEDVQPLLDICAVDRGLVRDVARDSREVLKLVQALGGSRGGYQRVELSASRPWWPRCTALRA